MWIKVLEYYQTPLCLFSCSMSLKWRGKVLKAWWVFRYVFFLNTTNKSVYAHYPCKEMETIPMQMSVQATWQQHYKFVVWAFSFTGYLCEDLLCLKSALCNASKILCKLSVFYRFIFKFPRCYMRNSRVYLIYGWCVYTVVCSVYDACEFGTFVWRVGGLERNLRRLLYPSSW